MYTLAFDNHKKYALATALDKNGTYMNSAKLTMKKESFEQYIKGFDGPCQAVIEAGYSWGQVYDILTELGVDVKVAHPLRIKAIASAKIKTDEIDSRTLAELLYANLLPGALSTLHCGILNVLLFEIIPDNFWLPLS
jgi:transposase